MEHSYSGGEILLRFFGFPPLSIELTQSEMARAKSGRIPSYGAAKASGYCQLQPRTHRLGAYETAPWAWGGCLAAYYALLGRDKEARAAFKTFKKEKFDVPGTVNLRYIMNSEPYKDRAVAGRLVEGLRKAGVPPANIPGGYFPSFKENRLTGEEIRNLLFGSRITGHIFYPQQFWIKFEKNGEMTWDRPSIGGDRRSKVVWAGLKGIRSAGSTKRDLGELNIAQLFCDTREARTTGKTSISGAPTLGLGLFPWYGDYGSLRDYETYCISQISSFREIPLVIEEVPISHQAKVLEMKRISKY
jgi:hypothetical protein